jgi:hypothetical protein
MNSAHDNRTPSNRTAVAILTVLLPILYVLTGPPIWRMAWVLAHDDANSLWITTAELYLMPLNLLPLESSATVRAWWFWYCGLWGVY